ncbi:MAG: FkbM family methyltransferase, partial [Verrucomicrobiales bacterium]|nr:FkbM family methyltransferase [Verrucomicrobiales bacterium]
PDGPAAFSAHQEIFAKRMYEIPAMESPRILDGGANIGLAAIFFCQKYPGARVTCFEADPDVAVYLRKNLAAAGAETVEVVEAALWSEDGSLTFSGEGSDAGRVGESGAGKTQQVRAVRLSPFLNERIDLLKLDIEGAEMAVLRECQNALGQVQRIFVEYHSFEGQSQCLDELLAILRVAGFRLAVTVSDALTQRPFIEPGLSLGMDMRLNVFGFRDHV